MMPESTSYEDEPIDDLAPIDNAGWDPRFTKNPVIRELARSPRWSMSDRDKRPLSMYAVKNLENWYGASTAKPQDMWPLAKIAENYPTTTNVAFWLKSKDCGYAVVDIEKTCPVKLMATLIWGLRWEYAEVSLSGRGYHLIIRRPVDLIAKYPDAAKAAIKEKHGYFEILLNHWVTFSMEPRASGPLTQPHPVLERRANELLENLFASQKPSRPRTWVMGDMPLPEIPEKLEQSIPSMLETQSDIFDHDEKSETMDKSRRDWVIACKAVQLVQAAMPGADENAIALVAANLLRKYMPDRTPHLWRDKYDDMRGDEPYLEYTVANAANATSKNTK